MGPPGERGMDGRKGDRVSFISKSIGKRKNAREIRE